jgi:hypothetical protein
VIACLSIAQGLVATSDEVTWRHRKSLVQLAPEHRLPATYWARAYVDDGGLMTYSASVVMAVPLLTLITSGCAPVDTVMMQHPRTHEIVQCAEGYRRFLGGDGYRGQEDCVADYQRQGYERAPAPAEK